MKSVPDHGYSRARRTADADVPERVSPGQRRNKHPLAACQHIKKQTSAPREHGE